MKNRTAIANDVTDGSATQPQPEKRLSLRRERVATLGLRTGLRTGPYETNGCHSASNRPTTGQSNPASNQCGGGG